MEYASQLLGHRDGSIFVVKATGLWRSRDDGLSWTRVPLPLDPPPRGRLALALDPWNSDVLYAPAAGGGLARTTNSGASWETLLAGPQRVLALAVSPADPQTLWAAFGLPRPTDFQLLRSRDGGFSWQVVDRASPYASFCFSRVSLLYPAPIQPDRLFASYSCAAGRTFSDVLRVSEDGGVRWRTLLRPQFAYPERLVPGIRPVEWWLVANQDRRIGGAQLFTSDDDGATWTLRLIFPERAPRAGRPQAWEINALVIDPLQPGRIWLGLGRSTTAGIGLRTTGGAILVTTDGGAVWWEASAALGEVTDLVLSADGRWLFAASERGLYRQLVR
ncbi:MAG: hypothetical protein KatS3mg061_1647 [Dehalococcoidia bacterium]|nr:MAG: hypothetical protein KatS3mg061_1647 [Dehalococcoidia bacterium]